MGENFFQKKQDKPNVVIVAKLSVVPKHVSSEKKQEFKRLL